ncbi:fungal-specific transcription factor domain-containing protein [Mycena pura]|uniref:Fungal-specific transcription factor domain-containing protein n=1 Tax=Mycena pura TaxID=153505 RepID=A0AAD6YG06_9AGAR|nr:fungal-specific transcription factor domain-containing protein [Mycena pura]
MASPPPSSSPPPEDTADKPPTQPHTGPAKRRQQRKPPSAAAPDPPHPPPVVSYPAPPYIMNHPGGYPMNASPFPQQYPPPPPPGTPGAPQYAYPVHSPYPPHYYPQYPPQMMMYGPPPPHAHQDPNAAPAAPSAAPADSASAGVKRKRKNGPSAATKDKASDDEAASPTDANASLSAKAALELKKRTKTQRACDSCRSRKIRCDILPETDPPNCQHCKQYHFECTFFLPITETRFKKKKMDDDPEKEKAEAKSPAADKRDSSVFGPTSTAHLLHSTASINSRMYESYDSRYHLTFEVSQSGDGLIRVEKPTQSEQQMTIPKPVDLHIEPQMVEQLLNAYFSEVAPILPVITQAEFLALAAPPPILLYSICLVAAARREVPQAVFDSIRYAVNGVIKADDVLSTPTMANVQALLILCMTGDCHSQFVPTALSAMWIRLGTAIRMAQDLGLHRAELVKQDIELRRRVWGACLIIDRWSSLVYGSPYMIDVHDCDVRLPSSGDSKELYMDELVRLSVIGGRVMKTIYSPSGLTLVTDEMLHKLLADLEAWKANLPENLKFHGTDTPQSAGILHMLYTSVCMIFWRVFMRISYSCPAHLKFALTVEQWSTLVELTGECIDWLDAHERVYDVWLLIAYAATSCAFVQYHTWVRRQDAEAGAKLLKLRDCVRRWEGSLSPDHMSARRKTAEIITLLYEATQGPQLPLETPALNPTGGVKNKQPPTLNYKPDPTRPGAGVFVAHKDSQDDFKDVPAGTVIVDGEGASGESQGEEALSSSSAFASPLSAEDAAMPRRVVRSVNNVAQAGAGATTTSTGTGTAAMVNLTPLTGRQRLGPGATNMNPAMNAASHPGHVQVMNVLDVPQASNTLAEYAMTDTTFLEGIPGGMFDWGQWDTFFSRMNHSAGAPVAMPPSFVAPAQAQE